MQRLALIGLLSLVAADHFEVQKYDIQGAEVKATLVEQAKDCLDRIEGVDNASCKEACSRYAYTYNLFCEKKGFKNLWDCVMNSMEEFCWEKFKPCPVEAAAEVEALEVAPADKYDWVDDMIYDCRQHITGWNIGSCNQFCFTFGEYYYQFCSDYPGLLECVVGRTDGQCWQKGYPSPSMPQQIEDCRSRITGIDPTVCQNSCNGYSNWWDEMCAGRFHSLLDCVVYKLKDYCWEDKKTVALPELTQEIADQIMEQDIAEYDLNSDMIEDCRKRITGESLETCKQFCYSYGQNFKPLCWPQWTNLFACVLAKTEGQCSERKCF